MVTTYQKDGLRGLCFCFGVNVAKLLKALVDADAANIDVMNVVQIAFARELEAQNQISERRDQLFNHNVKL